MFTMMSKFPTMSITVICLMIAVAAATFLSSGLQAPVVAAPATAPDRDEIEQIFEVEISLDGGFHLDPEDLARFRMRADALDS